MEDLLRILDRDGPYPTDGAEGPWDRDVEAALSALMAGGTGDRVADAMTAGRCWILLGWVERCASRLVGPGALHRLSLALFALQLLSHARALDDRELWLVASVVRYASSGAGLDYGIALADSCQPWMSTAVADRFARISSDLPSTHVETVRRGRRMFDRRPSDIDMATISRKFRRRED